MQASNFTGLSVQGVDFWRGDRQVLAGVTLDVTGGECVHVLGPNGSGKSTLLRIVVGLLTPEQGAVLWGGRPTRAQRDEFCAAACYLAHIDGLKPEFTAHENLAFDAGLRRLVQEEEIGAALSRVGLSHGRDQLVGTMSAGQRRRLAMARVALAAAPLWILDEPYTNLDSGGAALVAAMIGQHLDGGGGALIAAHQPPPIPHHVPRRLELPS